MDELASLMGPGAAALATLVVTDAVNGFKSLMRRVFPHAADTPDDDHALPGELAEAVEDAAAARALGDRAATRSAAAALEEALLAQLRDVLRQHPEAADEVRGVLADAVAAGAAPAAPAGVPRPAAARVPVLLPRITVRPQRHFQNHEDLLAAMDAEVAASRASGGPAYLHLTGIPGIGKRALVHRWLRRSAADLTGPQLEASLARDAWGNPPAPGALLERWLRRLGVPREDVPAETDERLALLADTLTGRRAVFLLTDVATPAQVGALVPADLDDAVVLLTSHSALPALRARLGAETLAVGPLDDPHSRALLFGVGRLDETARADHDKAAALARLTTSCAGHPLALVAVGAQLATGGPGRVFELADELSATGTGRGAFDTGDDTTSVFAVFDTRYRDLDAPAAHAYRCLGLHPAPEFGTDVLRAVLPGPDLAARHAVLRRLCDANLVVCLSGTRYAFAHPLVHAHARERALADEPAAAVDATRGRITGFYLAFLERAEAALSGRYRLDPEGVYPGYAPTGPVDEKAVTAGLADRHDALCQAVRLAHETGRHQQSWRMAQALHTYFLKGRLHSDWIGVHTYAVASARECNDLTALARMHFEAGFAHQDRCSAEQGDPEAARRHFDQALELVAAPGRTPTEAERRTRSSVLEARALLASKLGESAQALELLAAAEDALGDLHHPRGRALFALHRGTVHARRADHARAEAELLAAAERFAALTPPNRFNQAKALARCAEDRRAAGRTGDALDAVALALDALAGRGGPYQTGELLLLRGTLHHESGDPAQARRDWAAARGHFTEARSVRRAREAEELLARHGGGAGT